MHDLGLGWILKVEDVEMVVCADDVLYPRELVDMKVSKACS